MTTGEKIAEERKKINLTQKEFAEMLGVSRQAVSRWESDLAFPETETLIKMSDAFGCSVDYLLKYNAEEERSADGDHSAGQEGGTDGEGDSSKYTLTFDLSRLHLEYKSKTTVFGVPLVHVNLGPFAVAKGIIAIGPVAVGVLPIGVFGIGLLSICCMGLGAISLGALALGLLSFGGVAIGLIAFGGCAIGLYSLGGCAIGLFAVGGYANGAYVAVGDYAVGKIAFGETTANGSIISVTPQNFAELKGEAWAHMDDVPAVWQGFVDWCKVFAQSFMKV